MSWRSRWVIVPALMLAVIAGWNWYVAANANGVVTGTVLDAAGHPASGASVILYTRTFLTNDERARTKTGADGKFRFTANHDHALQLQAEQPGRGQSPRITVRLLFRGEDVDLRRPLRLSGSP